QRHQQLSRIGRSNKRPIEFMSPVVRTGQCPAPLSIGENKVRAVPGEHESKTMADAIFELLLLPEEAAKILNLSTSWLAKARMTGEGPEFVKIGRAIRYSMSSLQKFIQARSRKSTSDRPDENNDSGTPKNKNKN